MVSLGAENSDNVGTVWFRNTNAVEIPNIV